jgi:hypothetical protein
MPRARVQAVLVPRARFTLSRAKAWAKQHGYLTRSCELTPRFFRFNQGDRARFYSMTICGLAGGMVLVRGFRRPALRSRTRPKKMSLLGLLVALPGLP